MDKYEINFWGRFSSRRTERAYVMHYKSVMVAQNRYGILISGLGYWLVTVADYFKLGICPSFYATALIRTLLFALCFSIFLALKDGVKLRRFFSLSFTFVLANTVSLVSLIYILNPDKRVDLIDELTVPFITLMLFVLVQLPLTYLTINGVFAAVSYIVLLTVFFDTPLDFTINIVAVMSVLMLTGFILSRYMNIYRRKNFMHSKYIETLNFNLNAEMREKAYAQLCLQKMHKDLTDSIEYARNLQLSFMHSRAKIEELLPGSLLFFQPRDMVSGDFYWVGNARGKTIVAVADCTGHGVPAAFMSILGITLLNKIIQQTGSQDNPFSAASILEDLRTDLLFSFTQNEEINHRAEGMDIALCIIDRGSMSLQFAGAYSDLWLIRENGANPEVVDIKGDKMPIGTHVSPGRFVNHEVKLGHGDSVYLFTDGIIDQFGGSRNKRYMRKNFLNLLLQNQDKDMREQEAIVRDAFLSWKGAAEQVDDVLVLGITF